MEYAEQTLAELVQQRLAELGTNAFAFERAHNLPPDAIRSILRGGKKSGTTLNRAQMICEALNIDFHIGPPSHPDPSKVTVIKGSDFTAVPRYEAELAAGDGASNGDQDTVVETLAFRRDWLKRLRVSPSNACLVKVRGDSMEPLLHDQDMVLIDRSRRMVRSGKVYALVESGAARVKRLERPDDNTLVLRPDNPSYPLEFRRGADLETISILGQVVWSGHTW